MAVETVNILMSELQRCQVLSEPQLALIEREAIERFAEPKQLAKELVSRGWLTRYQARNLLLGRGSELTLGAYQLLDRIGAGGMGQVFKALHVPMNRIVALKVIRPELIADPTTLRRFHREVQAAAQLSHPNIVTVFDASRIGDTHFLAMEYIDGFDLADLVRDSGPLPIHSACDYIRQAAVGLQHAHDRGLIHRDVKPSNLLITRNTPAVVKILDMGLARPASIDGVGVESQSGLTLDGAVLGTPDFMAPEQAKNSSTVDHRADIYALGCTFYYVLTARMPFPVVNVMEKLLKHQLEQPYPVELVRPELPPTLLAVLHRMMAKDPEDRFQAADEVAQSLEPFCNGSMGPHDPRLDVVPAISDPKPSDANTPPPTSDASPFNFGETADEIDVPALRRHGRNRRFGWILGAIVIGFFVATVALVLLATWPARNRTTKPNESLSATPRERGAAPAELPRTGDTPRAQGARVSADLLPAFVPGQSSLAVIFNIPQLLNAKAVDSHLSLAIKPLLELSRRVMIDPRNNCDRLIMCVVPGSPDRTIAILSGSYASDELREFARRNFTINQPDAGIPIGSFELEKNRKQYIALLQDSFLAVASDPAMLSEADRRLREQRNSKANNRILELLATSRQESTIRFAILGSFSPSDSPLEAAGIHFLAGEVSVTDHVEMDARAGVRDARQFQGQLRSLCSVLGTMALFDPRHALSAALLRNPQIEPLQSRHGEFSEVRVRNTITASDLEVILKAIAHRIMPNEPNPK